MDLWLARWTPDREVRVRALAGSLCFVLGLDTLISQCLSLEYKWVQQTVRETCQNAVRLPAMD